MIPFHESLRYVYPLTKDSLVIDAGGFEGGFANLIAEKYGCKVHVYEPIQSFAENILTRFMGTPLEKQIFVHKYGIGAEARGEVFGVKGDQTGIACNGNHYESVSILPIGLMLTIHARDGQQVDLLKLNIEGMEYEVLESILDLGLDHRFNNIQVQFHNNIPHAQERRDFIKNRLHLNHRITWDADWVWTNFELK